MVSIVGVLGEDMCTCLGYVTGLGSVALFPNETSIYVMRLLHACLLALRQSTHMKFGMLVKSHLPPSSLDDPNFLTKQQRR